MYYLMDLERTILSGCPCFWKAGKRGYTYSITGAGEYSEIEAVNIVKDDFDNLTLKIKVIAIDNLIKRFNIPAESGEV